MIERAHVQTRIREVTRTLAAASGGAALCRLDGSATTAKELEGRMAALAEVRRALGRDAGFDPEPLAARWRADLEARRTRGSGQAWLSYLAGGVAELEAIATGGASPE